MDGLKNKDILLSIDIISGGISIFSDGKEIDFNGGNREISKAENVLADISELLIKNHLTNNLIKTIVISKTLFSSTGDKIVSAISKGLSRALGCRLLEVSALEALLLLASGQPDGGYVTAVPVAKNRLVWQFFTKRGESFDLSGSEARIAMHNEFYDLIKVLEFQKLIMESGLCNLQDHISLNNNVKFLIESDRRISELCGTLTLSRQNSV